MRNSILVTHYKKRKCQGYDIDVVEPRAQDAIFHAKKAQYHEFCLAWGCKIKRAPWKRKKIFTRGEYLTLLFAIIPGVWFHDFFVYVLNMGLAHIAQVAVMCVTVAVPLLYADTFFADYTKLPNTCYWRVLPLTFCFLPLQVASMVMTSVQGCVESVLYLELFSLCVLEHKRWSRCPALPLPQHVCFDEQVHSLSHRCRAAAAAAPAHSHAHAAAVAASYVACPDNHTYITAPQYFFIVECADQSFTAGKIFFMVIHWFLLGYVVYGGLQNYVKYIRWNLVAVLVLNLSLLLLMVYECGQDAIDGAAFLLGIDVEALFNLQPWRKAFAMATDIASWALPSNCAVSAGLVFRTRRWDDCAFVVGLSLLLAALVSAANYSVVGCLARRLHTSIDTVWKPHSMPEGDVIIAYFFKDYALGPLIVAMKHITLFLIQLWMHASLVKAIIVSLAETCKLLEHQSAILVAYLLIALPTSAFVAQYTTCYMPGASVLNKGLSALRLLNGTAYSATLFWLYGVARLRDDHLFMYGYAPVAGLAHMWRLMPLLFGITVLLDIKDNMIDKTDNTIIATYVTYLIVVVLNVLIIIYLQIKRKRPVQDLIHQAPNLGPPNSRLRRARELFQVHVGRGLLSWSRSRCLRRLRHLPPPELRPSLLLRRALCRHPRPRARDRPRQSQQQPPPPLPPT